MDNLGIGSRIKHPDYGVGVVIQVLNNTYLVTFIDFGVKEILKSFDKLEIIEQVEPSVDLVSFSEIERSLIQIIKRFSDIQETVPLGNKWIGGKMILYPGDKNLKEKEIPIEQFFHKIVMIRDRVRTMEQRINSSEISDEDKINLQQYITRIYGSLTTFNVLFKRTEDHFKGEKS